MTEETAIRLATNARRFAAVVLCCFGGAAADEFQNVKCGGDIPAALIGQRSSNEKVVAVEARHRDLGLKDLGGDEISDNLSSVSWQICGAEYLVLIDRKNVVRDVLPFPAHSRQTPAFSAPCKIKGRETPDLFVGVLDGAASGDDLPARAAWKIDQKQAKFVVAPLDGLTCPRSGVYTADGGK